MAIEHERSTELAASQTPSVRQNVLGDLRKQMDEAFGRLKALHEDLFDSSLIQGFSLFPLGEEMMLRPFGHVLEGSDAASMWREPFIRYEVADDVLVLTAEVPGVTQDDIKLDVGPDHLRLEAAHGSAQYKAFIQPGESLDSGGARATCADGVLRVRVPLREDAPERVRHIKVH